MHAYEWSKKWLAALFLVGTMVTSLVGCGGNDNNYVITNLSSDGGVAASHTDSNLKNGWGIAFNPTGYAWIADNGTSKATIYDGSGVLQQPVVSIPDGIAGPANPTGIVFNGGSNFLISQNGQTATSLFIFSGEAGTISAWSPTVNFTTAITLFDGGSTGNVYKGLALANFNNAAYLYATDFHNRNIDVFDSNFNRVVLAGTFTDSSMPDGYSPFGIQAINNQIYVTYALRDSAAHDNINGAGFGFINVFDTGGNFIRRLVSNGPLNAPWGMALAPANFGEFSNALLVGNFGDGKINVFDPTTGNVRGTLIASDGRPLVIDGLWGLAFGNDLFGFSSGSLYFAAGPSNETNGLFGKIDLK